MNEKQIAIANALSALQEQYPDMRVNNNKSIGTTEQQELDNESYIRQSMKRSTITNIKFTQGKFIKNAFSDSYFQSVQFTHNILKGNGFVCCNFIDTNFEGGEEAYIANNFSQSNFTRCFFENVIISESSLLQILFHSCTFSNVCIQSSTLEGTRFLGGSLKDVNLGQVNIEFVEFMDTSLSNITFPFYQFPYIIGIVDYMAETNANIYLCVNERNISLDEYRNQIDNLILYYESLLEYFPMCNLQIIRGMIGDAKNTLLNGINRALIAMDFRMIHHFCRLAQRHNLLDEVTINRILKAIEGKLTDSNIIPERLNDCIIHAGEIRKILLNERRNGITYNFHIKTNVQKNDNEGVIYINTLCNQLNDALSQNSYGQKGFEIAIANHSPFEIIIDVICAAGSVATIAQLIWSVVEHHKSHKSDVSATIAGYAPMDTHLYQNYIDTRIDLCKEQLLNLKDKYSSKKLNRHIEEITQKLKTDINELYDKDIMIFKKENHSD